MSKISRTREKQFKVRSCLLITLSPFNLYYFGSQSVGNHQNFLKRIRKTLYYGQLPATECLSLPVTGSKSIILCLTRPCMNVTHFRIGCGTVFGTSYRKVPRKTALPWRGEDISKRVRLAMLPSSGPALPRKTEKVQPGLRPARRSLRAISHLTCKIRAIFMRRIWLTSLFSDGI